METRFYPIKSLEINLIFCNEFSGYTSLHDARLGNGAISIQEPFLNDFWNSGGGIEIVINGFLCIYFSTKFHYLTQPLNFLMDSVCFVGNFDSKEKKLEREYYKDANTISLKANDINQSILEIRLVDEDKLSLEYKPTIFNDIKSSKQGRHFSNIIIERNLWIKEALLSIEDYFFFFEFYLKNNKSEKTEVYEKKLEYWEYIKATVKK